MRTILYARSLAVAFALKDGVLLTYFHIMMLGSDLQVCMVHNEHILWFYLQKELICLRL